MIRLNALVCCKLLCPQVLLWVDIDKSKSNVMIPIKKFKAMLEKDGSKYTVEFALEVREILYKLARLDYMLCMERQKEICRNGSESTKEHSNVK